ncbi:hypothetical protein C8R43DRAFT_886456 [Mycena crocata]|nr:hypothetical protein C8R43DRAFT_886456 [Mycena crocata]
MPDQITSIADGFRVLTIRPKENEDQTPAVVPHRAANGAAQTLGLVIDSAARRNRGGQLVWGSGLWYGPSDPRNLSLRIPASQNQTALTAIASACLIGIQRAPRNQTITVFSKSHTLRMAMTQRLQPMEDKGWIGIADRDPLRALAAELKARTGLTIFKDSKPSENRDFGEATALAITGTQSQEPSQLNFEPERSTELRGVKLSALTQALAYAGIKALRATAYRKATDNNVKQIQVAVNINFKYIPTPAQIWSSIRTKDLSRQVRNFYWKSIHSAHRIGPFWKHIPECEERGTCQFCGELEDLEHIALKCRRPGQTQVWALAKELWLKKHGVWPELSLGGILGCGLATFTDEEGRKLPGTTRLYRILISESLFEIWKIRNTTVLKRAGEPLPVNQIHNRWLAAINKCLLYDCKLTNHAKYGKQASISVGLVTQTWTSVLLNEEKLPRDWTRQTRVLVGIEPKSSRPPPRPPPGTRGRGR